MLTWMHISDIHVGLKRQDWLWPAVATALYDDIDRLHRKVGPWDLVFFTGDLTQSATRDEFARATSMLTDIWKRFTARGFNPYLVVVPGNHDLSRPAPSKPETLLLKEWWNQPLVEEGFWSDDNPYFKLVEAAFENYTSWKETLTDAGIRFLKGQPGRIPGDFSVSVTLKDTKVGVVGLNSAWLQIGPENYHGRLNVDVRQLLPLTNNDPAAWCNSHDLTVLLSHHPLEWLHPESRESWNSDINPPGRFDVHLFGHMHEPDALSVGRGGSVPQRLVQAASLFGLEKARDGKITRIHGYSVGRIAATGKDRTYSQWPRRLVMLAGGSRKLVADQTFDLDDHESFLEKYSVVRSRDTSHEDPDTTRALLSVTESDQGGGDILDKVSYHIPSSEAHFAVRKIEQQRCIAGIQDTRAVWVVSEWGMGEDGFIGSVKRSLGEGKAPVFRVDMAGFDSKDRFLSGISEKIGCSFEKLCEVLSSQGPCYIVLDNVPISSKKSASGVPSEVGIEQIVLVLLEYCPEARIVLLARTEPCHAELPRIQLVPLDEAETALYLANSETGEQDLSRPDIVGQIYRLAGGAPSRLDTVLKELEVAGLSELVSARVETSIGSGSAEFAPEPLESALAELSATPDPELGRAFDLLKALSVFVFGEQLDKIKRFNGTRPFFPSHARALLERGLISATVVPEISSVTAGATAKILSVPPIVRECLRQKLTEQEALSLERRAMELYFGNGWYSGAFNYPAGHRFSEGLCNGNAISNANELILRLVARAVSTDDMQALTSALMVASAYVERLDAGDHYHSVVVLCEDVLALVPAPQQVSLDVLKVQFSRALRMSGLEERAVAIIEEVDIQRLPRRSRKIALTTLALSHQEMDNTTEALWAAKEVLKLDRDGASAVDAQFVTIQLGDSTDKDRNLKALEQSARKKGFVIVANSIALSRLESSQLDPVSAREILEPVFKSAVQAKDFYNATHASVRVAKITLDLGEELSELEMARLIASYHFLFNERMSSLFDKCHDVLWRCYEADGDIENLLRLFRYSSLTWRLRGEDEREGPYLDKLTSLVDVGSNSDVRTLNLETAYYLVRASAASKQSQVPSPSSIIEPHAAPASASENFGDNT